LNTVLIHTLMAVCRCCSNDSRVSSLTSVATLFTFENSTVTI